MVATGEVAIGTFNILTDDTDTVLQVKCRGPQVQLPVAKGMIQDHGMQNEEQHARGGDGSLFLGFALSPARIVWCASDLTGARTSRTVTAGNPESLFVAGKDARSVNGTSTRLDGAGFCEWARTPDRSAQPDPGADGGVRTALTMVRAV